MERIPIVVLDPAGADASKDTPRYNPATGVVEWAEGGGVVPSGTALPSTVTNGTLFALIKPGTTGPSTWATKIQAKSPLAWYRHGEAAGTSAMVDASGNSRSGAYTGAPTLGTTGLISGSTDTAVTFAGAEAGTVTDPPWLNGLSAVTFLQRIKLSALQVMLLERDSELKSSVGGSGRDFQIRIEADGKLSFIFFDASQTVYSGSGGSVVTGGTYTIGVSFGGGQAHSYINGQLVATAPVPATLASAARDLQIGASPSSAWNYKGVLDETVIIGTELSAADHADLHDAAVNGTAGSTTADTVTLYYAENGQWVAASSSSSPSGTTSGVLRGDWVSTQTYAAGDFVTYQGSLWKSTAASNTTTPGAAGATWTRSVDGHAVPAGGTAGQALKKASTADYDYGWADDLQGTGGGGGGSSYPPGSADIPPTVANARDDEFDGSSTVTWTATPTAPSATDRNTTRPHHLYIKVSGTGATMVGRYQPAPTTYPFTIKTKTTSTARANYHKAGGIILLPANPTTSSGVVYAGPQFNGGFSWVRGYYTNMGATFSSQSAAFALGIGRDWYTRVVVNSATSISCYASTDGYGWALYETFTVPFSIANIGLAGTEESAGGGIEAFFDFFRVS